MPTPSSWWSSRRTWASCSTRSRRVVRRGALVVSLAAGITTAFIEERLPEGIAGRAGDAEHARARRPGHGGDLARARTATTRTSPGPSPARADRPGRPGAGVAPGRGDRDLRLRAGVPLLRGRGDDRGRRHCSGCPAPPRPSSSSRPVGAATLLQRDRRSTRRCCASRSPRRAAPRRPRAAARGPQGARRVPHRDGGGPDRSRDLRSRRTRSTLELPAEPRSSRCAAPGAALTRAGRTPRRSPGTSLRPTTSAPSTRWRRSGSSSPLRARRATLGLLDAPDVAVVPPPDPACDDDLHLVHDAATTSTPSGRHPAPAPARPAHGLGTDGRPGLRGHARGQRRDRRRQPSMRARRSGAGEAAHAVQLRRRAAPRDARRGPAGSASTTTPRVAIRWLLDAGRRAGRLRRRRRPPRRRRRARSSGTTRGC